MPWGYYVFDGTEPDCQNDAATTCAPVAQNATTPGSLVMTAPVLLARGVRGFTDRAWGPAPARDQKVGGGTMVAIAEAVELPLSAAIIVSSVRADEADAREVDAALDAPAGEEVEPGRERPWRETDPRDAGRRSPG